MAMRRAALPTSMLKISFSIVLLHSYFDSSIGPITHEGMMDPFQCQFLSNLHSFLEVNIGFKILVLKIHMGSSTPISLPGIYRYWSLSGSPRMYPALSSSAMITDTARPPLLFCPTYCIYCNRCRPFMQWICHAPPLSFSCRKGRDLLYWKA